MKGQSKVPLYHRRSIRLPGYDYSAEGEYFITIVTKNRASLFGEIKKEEIKLSSAGRIVWEVWINLSNRYPQVELGTAVVMPNHFHGIISIVEPVESVGAIHELPLRNDLLPRDDRTSRRRMLLPLIVGYFKMNTAKQINALQNTNGLPLWQRNYYEHVINSDEEFQQISDYIKYNPANWGSGDEYYQ